jgi:hypothetical protein
MLQASVIVSTLDSARARANYYVTSALLTVAGRSRQRMPPEVTLSTRSYSIVRRYSKAINQVLVILFQIDTVPVHDTSV